MNLFSAGHLIYEGGKNFLRLFSAKKGAYPPALYEKAKHGVSNNIVKE
jgi:hypothetical protein